MNAFEMGKLAAAKDFKKQAVLPLAAPLMAAAPWLLRGAANFALPMLAGTAIEKMFKGKPKPPQMFGPGGTRSGQSPSGMWYGPSMYNLGAYGPGKEASLNKEGQGLVGAAGKGLSWLGRALLARGPAATKALSGSAHGAAAAAKRVAQLGGEVMSPQTIAQLAETNAVQAARMAPAGLGLAERAGAGLMTAGEKAQQAGRFLGRHPLASDAALGAGFGALTADPEEGESRLRHALGGAAGFAGFGYGMRRAGPHLSKAWGEAAARHAAQKGLVAGGAGI